MDHENFSHGNLELYSNQIINHITNCLVYVGVHLRGGGAFTPCSCPPEVFRCVCVCVCVCVCCVCVCVCVNVKTCNQLCMLHT